MRGDTHIEEQDLIELIVPVYGLDDAPLRWFETVTTFLKKIGLRRSLLDPCVHVKHDAEGKIEALVLIEVDDFLIATKNEAIQKELKEKLQNRFLFGKWESGEADFIGRRCKKMQTEVRMDQEKYILEKLEAIPLSKGRRGNKDEPLTEEEFKAFRSMLYRVSWVAHQTRPEAAGTVSILSSRLHSARIRDVVDLNKMIGHLRSTSAQGLRFKKFKPDEMTFIGVSDAGGVDGEVRSRDERGLPEDPVQGAWMVLAFNLLPAHDQRIPISVLSWRSFQAQTEGDEHNGERNYVAISVPGRGGVATGVLPGPGLQRRQGLRLEAQHCAICRDAPGRVRADVPAGAVSDHRREVAL